MELCNSPVIAGRCKRYARHAVGKIDALCLPFDVQWTAPSYFV